MDPMKVYTAAVETANFSLAAKKLDITPSAVSKQISQLENHLGVLLLNRTTRSISPTEAGTLYYNRCKMILEAIRETNAMVKDLESSLGGTLRMWVPSVFGRSLLARVIADFSHEFPNIDIELFLSDAPMDLIGGGFDMGIYLGELPDSRLVAKAIGPLSLVLCASPEYIEKHGEPSALEDLAEHPILVVTGNEYIDIRKVSRLAEPAKLLERSAKLNTNDLDLAYHSTHAGLGISALPYYLIQRSLKKGSLIHLLRDFETPGAMVHMVFPKTRYMPHKTRRFIDFLSTYFIELAEQLRTSIEEEKQKH
ncbi:hypothetical protein A9Q99_03120 [Gammaproteobacteria bacterium 45_16_T64]|nr:hypothetical protein A9Q99_03120 [Gammaproteobacteria bacterium 45_16_T64]